jgi:citrate lyase subunit beta/citryl-CoA lyase
VARSPRLRRSELATPGISPEMAAKAAQSGADLVFLDLEDAVAPAQKEPARSVIVDSLNNLNWGSTVRAFRINGVHTKWCHDDLIEVVTGAGQNIDIVIVPKVRTPRDVWFVDDLLTQLERKIGLETGQIGLEVLIEEASALSCVEEIASCSNRLEALILGVGDLAASQGVRTKHIGGLGDYRGDVWHFARSRMIVAARANGLDPIDGPYADFKDSTGYVSAATEAATLGALGKWCIHPAQIALANAVYTPSEAEIAEADSIVRAVQKAQESGLGAATYEGQMIDEATARIYSMILSRAEQCGVGPTSLRE